MPAENKRDGAKQVTPKEFLTPLPVKVLGQIKSMATIGKDGKLLDNKYLGSRRNIYKVM